MNSKEAEICIKEYGQDIYRFCCFLTGKRDLADDLYQECFLCAMKSKRNIKGICEVFKGDFERIRQQYNLAKGPKIK